jgi:hypothetical protein
MTDFLPYFLIAYSAVLTIVVITGGYFLAKFSMTILKFQEEVEKSLEILDERYSSISKVLEIPLFFDSPEVRRVVEDVGMCRNSILQVAQTLGNVEEE